MVRMEYGEDTLNAMNRNGSWNELNMDEPKLTKLFKENLAKQYIQNETFRRLK